MTMSWRKPNSSSASRGYGYRWQKARASYLNKHPLCVMCLKAGRTTPATVVDHIKPHRGDSKLFWDSSNWQALCKHCHDSEKQFIEKNGFSRVYFGEDGYPIGGGVD